MIPDPRFKENEEMNARNGAVWFKKDEENERPWPTSSPVQENEENERPRPASSRISEK